MNKIEVGSYVTLVQFERQKGETAEDLAHFYAVYGSLIGEDFEVTGSYRDAMEITHTSGESFEVYSNEVKLVG